jgi:lactate dehydrogenase-like 2-hydroxyacid dehydrogenase
MAPESVVVTRSLPHLPRRLLDLEPLIWDSPDTIPPETLQEWVAGAHGVLCTTAETIDAAVIAAGADLRVISTYSVGLDHIDLEAATSRSIPVGHTPDVLTETVADTTLGLLLAAARRFQEGIEHVRSGAWTGQPLDLLLGYDVHGSTLGIVGMGRIGLAVARRAAAFGMEVLYHDVAPVLAADARGARGFRGRLHDLLAESDHVVITVPLTAATHHLIDATALAAMKPTATLVNTSRGGTVDPDALADALACGELAAAALDVTEPEPIPVEHPLVGLPNCTIVPHLGSATHQTRRAMADLAVDNLLAGLAGKPLPACANPAVQP